MKRINNEGYSIGLHTCSHKFMKIFHDDETFSNNTNIKQATDYK